MSKKRQNIGLEKEWFIGEDRKIKLKIDQADETTPQTMTGFGLTWELKDSPTGTVLISKTTGAGEIVIENGDGTDDQATVTILGADTVGLTPGGILYHHLRRTDEGNEVVLAFGDAHLRASGIT